MKICFATGGSIRFEVPGVRKEGQRGAAKKVVHTVSVPTETVASLNGELNIQLSGEPTLYEYKAFPALIGQYADGDVKPVWAGILFHKGQPFNAFAFDNAPGYAETVETDES